MQSIPSNSKKILEEILNIIRTTPNDMVLGEKLRKYYNDTIGLSGKSPSQ
jgi:hypothetical protein